MTDRTGTGLAVAQLLAARHVTALSTDAPPSAPCLSPEQAYQLSLDRRSAELPRYQPASTRDGIEVFGRAISVIAAARSSAHHAAETCVTRPSIQSSIAW